MTIFLDLLHYWLAKIPGIKNVYLQVLLNSLLVRRSLLIIINLKLIGVPVTAQRPSKNDNNANILSK